MPDVTGRIYEAFTEFLLRRLNYRDEWTEGTGRQYLYERHREALCHTSVGICPHAIDCNSFSRANNIPYGPWYDPDFFILEDDVPTACLHITHWSEQRSSKKKFWRTIEDHFQYKTLFGHEFLSINLLFVALTDQTTAQLFVDTLDRVHLHGWDPAIGSVLVGAFDASIVFPRHYPILERFTELLPEGRHGAARQRRRLYNTLWEQLYAADDGVRTETDRVVSMLRSALSGHSSRRYPQDAITHLQSVCYHGRLNSANLTLTASRYRKGIQHAFILRELIARHWENVVDPGVALWSVLTSPTRFPIDALRAMLKLPIEVDAARLADFQSVLSAIPTGIDQGNARFLLNQAAGIGHSAWEMDFQQFISGLTSVSAEDKTAFRAALEVLYGEYRQAYGMNYVLADLSDRDRIRRKVEYVSDRYLGLTDKQEFIDALAADMLTPGEHPPHQEVVPDVHNWPLDVILTFYELGAIQEIDNRIFSLFERTYSESLRLYAYQGNYIVGYLQSGVDLASIIHRNARFSRDQFYTAIWPLIAECVWEAIRGRTALTIERAELMYCYKKARRIIASDLEPITHMLNDYFPNLTEGPKLRGAFNQLSRLRGWSNAALITETSGQDPTTNAVIHTQTVVGAKNIDHKVKELSGRMRSVQLRCEPDGYFTPEISPGHHYLVVDGDWPVTSKVNLLEAGFDGIFEIAQLERLSERLTPLDE